MEEACKQIIDGIVSNILKLEERAVELSSGQVSSFGHDSANLAHDFLWMSLSLAI